MNTDESSSAQPRISAVAVAISLAITLGIGAVGGLAAAPGAWYASLDKPTWNPPQTVFGPVWITLYVMIGFAAALAWSGRETRTGRTGFLLYAFQLVLNALWSWLFFRWHRPDLALADLLVMWVAILGTIIAFRRIRPLAGTLLIPYLAWVTFAGVLNAEIARRNPQGVSPTPVGPTQGVAAADCAPWDGAAISIYLSDGPGAGSLPPPAPYLHIALYGSPEQLAEKTITLGRSEAGSGIAVWCLSDSSCSPASSGTVEMGPVLHGSPLTGSYLISFPDRSITAVFSAGWQARPVICG